MIAINRYNATHGQGVMFGWILLAFVVITFPILFLGHTLYPVVSPGVLPGGAYGYDGAVPVEGSTRDPLGSMGGDLIMEEYTRDNLFSGDLPLWNPYMGIGYPSGMDPASKLFYAPNLLRLLLPTEYWDLIGLAHILLISSTLFFFGRLCGISSAGSALSGVAAFGVGHWLLYLPATSIIQTAAWAPVLLYSIESAFKQRDWRLNSSLFAAAVYGMGTGGHPGPAIFALIGAAIYVLTRILQEKENLLRVLLLVPAGLLGAAIAAPTWINLLDLLSNDLVTTNSVYPTLYNYKDLPALVFPYLFGPVNSNFNMSNNAWGIGYFVTPIVFFAVAALSMRSTFNRSSPTLGLVFASAFLLAWALDLPGINLVKSISLLSRANTNYLWTLPAMLICFGAGLGLDAIRDATKCRWTVVLAVWGAVIFSAAALFFLALNSPASQFDSSTLITQHRGLLSGLVWAALLPTALLASLRLLPPDRSRIATIIISFSAVVLASVGYFPAGGAMVSDLALIAFAGTAVLAIIAFRFDISRSFAVGPVVLALTFIPALAVNVANNMVAPGLPERYNVFKKPPFIDQLQKRTKQDPSRVFSFGGVLFPNFSTAFKIESANQLVATLPTTVAAYYNRMDEKGNPLQYWAFVQLPTPREFLTGSLAWDSLYTNRRFWNQIGVHYILSTGLPLDYTSSGIDHELSIHLDSPFTADMQPQALLDGDGSVLEQPVGCEAGAFDRIALKFSTFGRINHGPVQFTLLNGTGQVVERFSRDGSEFDDNRPYTWRLNHPACTDPDQSYVMRLNYTPPPNDSAAALMVWRRPGMTGFYLQRIRQADANDPPELKFAPTSFDQPIVLRGACPASRSLHVMLALGNYAKTNPGILTARYQDSSGHVTETSDETAAIKDNQYFTTAEATGVCLNSGDSLVVTLTFVPSIEGSMIAYWADSLQNIPMALLMAKRTDALQLVYEDSETDVKIWENDEALPRFFLTQNWQQVADWREAQNRSAAQPDLRDIAFVEEDILGVCPPSADLPARAVEIESHTINSNQVHATVTTQTGGLLAAADLWMEGWTAQVNGNPSPVYRVNGVFRGVCLPEAGRYEIVYSFEPPKLKSALMIAGFGLSGLLILIVGGPALLGGLRRSPR